LCGTNYESHKNPGTPGTKVKDFRNNLKILCHPISKILYEHIGIDRYERVQVTQGCGNHATRCNTLQHAATEHTENKLHHCKMGGDMQSSLQNTAANCATLQHTATYCTTLQRTTTHCIPA